MKRFLALPLPLALIAGPAAADPEGYGHMTHWGTGYGAGMMLGPVLWLLVLGLIVAGLIWPVRRDDRATRSAPGNSAREALDLRFARGEIDAEDYATRKSLLAE